MANKLLAENAPLPAPPAATPPNPGIPGADVRKEGRDGTVIIGGGGGGGGTWSAEDDVVDGGEGLIKAAIEKRLDARDGGLVRHGVVVPSAEGGRSRMV